ncbi:MAG: hypothetical protein K0R34_2139 [Herbinix sp.]|jgi:hypothetical protein|nr:hypothetical protein [Herbinix sp.]
MGKRRTDTLRSPSEIRQDSERHYNAYIKEAKKQPSLTPKKRKSISTENSPSVILRDVTAGDTRKCSQCECTNDKGFCDNYFLFAVMREMCRRPVEEVV